MTVEQLIARLRETPSHYDVIVETINADNDEVTAEVSGAIIDTKLQTVIIKAK